MRTKSIYAISVILIVILIAAILYYVFDTSNTETVFEGTLVKNLFENHTIERWNL